MKLLTSALLKFVCGIMLVGLLIFLPAGTIHYAGGWLLMGILFVPILLAGIVMLAKSPALLEKRLNGKEKGTAQQRVVALSALMFIGGFVVAGLDHRFGWSSVPLPVTVTVFTMVLPSSGEAKLLTRAW